LEFLTRNCLNLFNNQARRRKISKRGNRKQRLSNSIPRQPSLLSSGGLGAALGNCPEPNLN